MENRITDNHKSGRGDAGFSDLAQGKRISKGTSLSKIYGAFDMLQHSLSTFLENPDPEVPEEDLRFFEYLLQMTFAINGFLYFAGKTEYCDNLLFDSACIEFIDSRVEFFKEFERKKLNKTNLYSEFIIPKGFLNEIRLRIRQVEAEFWFYRDQLLEEFMDEFRLAIVELDSKDKKVETVHEKLSSYLEMRSRFNWQGGFLNRLSTYLYWLMRFCLVKNGGDFQCWISKAPKWEG